MFIFLLVTFVLFLAYSCLIVYYQAGWNAVPFFNGPKASAHAGSGEMNPGRIPVTPRQTTITVIIPARNEEANIGPLLEALLLQDYPVQLTEIVVIDDQSTDNTAAIVESFSRRAGHIKLIRLNEQDINSYKKKAISTGIAATTGEFIITTDADCLPGPSWLSCMEEFRFQRNLVMIAGPVRITHNAGMLQTFQSMDFLVLQGITAASVHRGVHAMANGANLGYDRAAFNAVNGFEGIDSIASGDDMLLMYKIHQRFLHRLDYLKSAEAMVSTQPQYTLRQFLQQRIRWASKATKYQDRSMLPVLLLVYLVNCGYFALLVLSLINSAWLPWFAAYWLLKTLVEFPFFLQVSGFFGMRKLCWLFPFFQPLHVFYTVISGLLGQSGSYEWKGRRVR